ncbi:DUF6197 family protein [Streptomonospora arabica]|uniref:Uncharacterized protein n=1 Tax=Streptomonospora arabica TaxID=412417 RepID=A0ABV9SSF9_9ACTN
MTYADILRRAATLLEREGWCRCTTLYHRDARNGEGAIWEAAGVHEPPFYRECVETAKHVCNLADRHLRNRGLGHLSAYEARPETTAADVITALRAAAEEHDHT